MATISFINNVIIDGIKNYINKNLDNLLCNNNKPPSSFEQAESKSTFFQTSKKDEKYKYRIKYLHNVRSLTKGMSFGDLALLSTKPRSATITCETNTILAYLTREHYRKILGHVKAKQMQKTIEFFSQFLENMSTAQMMKVIYEFQLQDFHIGNYVFKDGEQAKGLYMISEGEFEIIKTIVTVDATYDPRFGPTSKVPQKSETIRIYKLCSGDSFGLLECFQKPFRHEYSVKCTSSVGKAYFLKLSAIDRMSIVTRRKIFKEGESKSQAFNERIASLTQYKRKWLPDS